MAATRFVLDVPTVGSFDAMENIYSNDWDVTQDQPGYRWRRIRIARRLGGEMLGASIYLIEPGEKSFPYHFHRSNEEMLIVLDGEVMVRTPERERSAGKGDALIFNRGPEGAHQVINRSNQDARIMMLSTMVEPEIAEYPDSGKVGLFAGAPPGGSSEDGLRTFLDRTVEVGYFDGD